MLSLSRRGFIILGAAGAVTACTSTMPIIPAGAARPETLSKAEIIAAINAVRRANGQPAWAYNDKLASAAKFQADLMASKDHLSHDLGVTLRQRVTAAGYEGAVGENVAGGQKTIEVAIAGWMNSPGHRSTLLSNRFTEFGLAMSRVGGSHKSRYGIYWSMIAGGSFDAWRVYQ